MGKDIESSFHRQDLRKQCFNAESLKLPFDLGMQNASIPFAMPSIDTSPPIHALPPFSGVHNLIRPAHMKEPHGLYYHLPHIRHQGLVPNMTLQGKLLPNGNVLGKVSTSLHGKPRDGKTLIPTIQCAPKQFLVFDQTGNKTTMMFSSGVGTQVRRLSSWSPKPTHYQNPNDGELGLGIDQRQNCGRILTDELDDDDHVTDEESEMREDSEEIDALLYSDDEGNYSDNTEETSTGHSPSSMTAHEKQKWFDEEDTDEEDTDEVASSVGPCVKKQKLSESSSEVPSITNATSPVYINKSSEYEDDAESSCAGEKPMGSFSGNKRLRNEKIRKTVSILQTIIPDGQGKDAIVVLDEAINYLRTLKFKAKTLGLSAL